MGQMTLVLTEKAESFLRGKNNFKGDMGRYISELLEREESLNKPNLSQNPKTLGEKE